MKLNYRRAIVTVILSFSVFVVGCNQGDQSGEADEGSGGMASNRVFASNYPLAYMAGYVSEGSEISIYTPWEGKGDPAYWSPSPEEVTEIQASSVILLNGADYETWLASVTLPMTRVINSSRSFREEWITIEDVAVHTHGPEGEHSHGKTAITTWLNLDNARKQLAEVKAALVKQFPDHQGQFEERATELDAYFADLHEQLKETGTKLAGVPLFGSHPVYQYLAAAYGLDIMELHLEPDAYPTEGQLAKIKSLHEERGIQWVLWEAKPIEKTSVKLMKMGIQSLIYSPAGNKPERGDFRSVMKLNVRNLDSIVQ